MAEEPPQTNRDQHATGGPDGRDLETLVHELQIHEDELAIQNEELRDAHRRLSAVRDAYHDLYEFAPVGYVTVDAGGVIRRANLSVTRLFGRARTELIGRRLELTVVPESRDDCYRFLQRALTGQEVETREFRLQRDDPSAVWVSAAATAQTGPDGAIEGLRVTLSDITDRKRAERDLQRLQVSLEEKIAGRTAELQQKSSLLHELVVELSSAEDRERRNLADLLHDELQQLIVAAVFHLNRMKRRAGDDADGRALVDSVRNLLLQANDLSRDLAYRLSPPLIRQQGLVAAVTWLSGDMKKKHGLEVELAAPEEVAGLPEALTILLYQAVRELLFNVVKHAGTDRAKVTISHEADRLTITVEDGGSGFDSVMLNATVGHAGFGLRRLQERVEALAGTLAIRTSPGQGCRVRFQVPLVVETADDRGPGPADRGKHGVESPRSGPAAGDAAAPTIRIMIVDDHEVIRDGLSSLLDEEPDIDVVATAADGRSALATIAARQPDVVLMDIAMPGATGDEVTRQIRQLHPHVRVIGLSMYPSAEAAERMRQAGAHDYFCKADPTEGIVASIRRVVRCQP